MELKDAHCFGYGYLAMDVTNEFGGAFSMKGSKKIHTLTLDTVKNTNVKGFSLHKQVVESMGYVHGLEFS